MGLKYHADQILKNTFNAGEYYSRFVSLQTFECNSSYKNILNIINSTLQIDLNIEPEPNENQTSFACRTA